MHRRVRHLNPANCGAVVALDGRFGVSGSPVSTWTGRTGTSINATGAGAVRPTTSTINGVPALLFDGVDDVLTLSSLTSYNNKSYGRLLVVVVDNNTASGGAQHPVVAWSITGSAGAGSRIRLDTKNTSAGAVSFGRRLDADATSTTAVVGTVTSAFVGEVVADWGGNALKAGNNGSYSASVTYASGAGSTTAGDSVYANVGGFLAGGGAYTNATVGAVVAWNATAAEALFRRVRHALGFTFRIKTA